MKKIGFYTVVLGLLFLGCFLFIFFEQAHFDSDQAISGLMAKHLSEGRHFPVFTYGAKYVLGFETWLAAPFMYFWGASVATLKIPLLLLNSITVCLLVKLLQKNANLNFFWTFLALLVFIFPAPITASRIIHAAIGTPTSFLACILVWVLWERTWALAILLGFVIPIRPYLLFAVMAQFILEAWDGKLFARENLKKWAKIGVVVIGMNIAVKLWGRSAPNYKGPSIPAFVIKDPITFAKTLWWLITENLPTLFGMKPNHLIDYNVTSSLDSGCIYLTPLFVISIFVFGFRSFGKKSWAQIKSLLQANRFPAFLMLTGLICAFIYTAFVRNAENIMLVRYTLMTLFFPIGYVAFFYRTEADPRWRKGLATILLIWFGQNIWDQGNLIHEYFTQTPQNSYRILAQDLASHQLHYGQANFWTSVHVTFFTREQSMITENDFSRIDEYVPQIEVHRSEAVRIADGSCPANEGRPVARWCILGPPLR